jgi:hypothetical protein
MIVKDSNLKVIYLYHLYVKYPTAIIIIATISGQKI